MTVPADKSLLLFDGDCGLCNGLMQFIIKRDKKNKFLFAPLQSAIGQAILKSEGLQINYLNSFIYISEEKRFEKSTATLSLLRDLGGFWEVCYVFIIVPKPIRDWVYDVISKYRRKIIGRHKCCVVPSTELTRDEVKGR
jgi:predicted DCC family thiol-disulfide oxidoreductase YuxK